MLKDASKMIIIDRQAHAYITEAVRESSPEKASGIEARSASKGIVRNPCWHCGLQSFETTQAFCSNSRTPSINS